MDISPASIDRLLAGRRSQFKKSTSFTKPGTLLKHQIPIRTWADWSEDRPGFCEMDLVDHSGGVLELFGTAILMARHIFAPVYRWNSGTNQLVPLRITHDYFLITAK